MALSTKLTAKPDSCAIARSGLRKLRAFLRREVDFDDALTVEEYYLEVKPTRSDLVGIQGKM